MKTFYCLICIALLQYNFVYSQKKEEPKTKKKDANQTLKENYEIQYSLAIETKDYSSACSALYGLLAVNQDDTNSLDCLLTIYFDHHQYEQCFNLSKRYLQKFRDNYVLLDYNGKSAELLGRYTDALEAYQKLYFLNNIVYYAYLSANAEYVLGRKKECLQHTELYLQDKKCLMEEVTFDIGNSKSQTVLVKAALLHLKGLVLSDDGDFKSAREQYVKALEVSPDFDLAKKSFESIKDK